VSSLDNALNATAAPEVHQERTVVSVNDVTMRFPIAKRYREWLLSPFTPRRTFTALKHVSLEIQSGDRVAVMGPNGAGKTTLLKLIGGLLYPAEGAVFVNGLSTLSQNGPARRSVGFVFNEERSFFWRLTGLQNLEFFGTLDNLYGPHLHSRIRELIQLVGLEHAAHKRVGDYSSGMKQRLALARVLIADPDILILDEPTRALDPVACEEMTALILSDIQQRSQKTLLIATHRTEEALTLCNKVMVIDGGQLRGFDSLSNVTSDGSTLLHYYRRCMSDERNYEIAIP
jgi:ABC-2 type transport system ATP-binding protein